MTLPKPKLANKANNTAHTDWPDPQPLSEELPKVPPFPLELLPESLRPLVADISERMQTPADYAAAAAIVSLAGCVSRRAAISAKQEDKSWIVIPNLWGAIIGPPGVMKSPVLRGVTAPLQRIEEMFRETFKSESDDYEQRKEEAELRRSAWQQDFKRAFRNNEQLPIRPDTSITSPKEGRLVLQSATFEKLHEILCENPAGVIVIRDELTGWLAELEHPGREHERTFYLEAWNGDVAFRVDRIGRGSVYVPAVCVSILGGIQPNRLRWYTSQVLSGGSQDDGLLQRFQIAVWPDLPPGWELVDRPVNTVAFRTAENIFQRLVEISPDDPARMRFDSAPQEFFYCWWTELEKKIRSDLPTALTAHFSKYRSLVPSLAGLFELADRAATGTLASEIVIGWEHTEQAISLCDDYLSRHAERIYSCITNPEMRAARELAKHLQRGDLETTFSTRQVYFKGWSGLTTPEAARKALEILEDAAWVRRIEPPASAQGGRPPEEWEINPKVMRGNK